jgi:cytidylate kinase
MVNGRACSGKDVIGDYISTRYDFKKVFFADPIYEIAKKYFGMKEKDRPLLIIIGDKLREIDMNVFVKYLLNNLKKDEDYIITDVRRDNEYILCKEAGFIPIRVKADLGIRIKRSIERDGKYPDTALWEGHSETGADNFEYLEIENNGTLDELYRKIDIFMKQFDDMEERKRLFDNRYRWFTEEY